MTQNSHMYMWSARYCQIQIQIQIQSPSPRIRRRLGLSWGPLPLLTTSAYVLPTIFFVFFFLCKYYNYNKLYNYSNNYNKKPSSQLICERMQIQARKTCKNNRNEIQIWRNSATSQRRIADWRMWASLIELLRRQDRTGLEKETPCQVVRSTED